MSDYRQDWKPLGLGVVEIGVSSGGRLTGGSVVVVVPRPMGVAVAIIITIAEGVVLI